AVVSGGNVGTAVFVKVPGRHGNAVDVVVLARLQRAVPLAQIDADAAIVVVAYHQILLAIGIEVGGDDVVQTVAGAAEGRGHDSCRQCAAAVVQKHADGGVAVVGGGQVGLAVAVEVGGHHPVGVGGVDGHVGAGAEGTAAAAVVHRDGVAAIVGA